jgi:hypothetical protein
VRHPFVGGRRGHQVQGACGCTGNLLDGAEPEDVGVAGRHAQRAFTAAADQQRWPGPLHGRWLLARAAGFRERPLKMLDHALEPVETCADRFPGDAGLVEFRSHGSPAEAEVEPSARELVGRGDLAGEQRGVPEADVEHAGAHPDPLGRLGSGDRERERRRCAQVIADVEHVVAQPFGLLALGAEGGGVTDAEEVEPEAVRAGRRCRRAGCGGHGHALPVKEPLRGAAQCASVCAGLSMADGGDAFSATSSGARAAATTGFG